MRIKLNRKTVILISLAVMAGIFAAFSAQKYIHERIQEIEDKSKVEKVSRIVAAYDLPVGTKIESAHVAVREIPREWVLSGSLTPEDFIHIEGQVITVALKRGDPLLWANTATVSKRPFSEKINVGRRAITMPVDSINSVSGMLVPGDLIDLYVSFEYRQRQITAPLLQGVLVMATGKQSRHNEEGDESTFSTVTLDTAPEEAAKLVAARQAGTITALLRNPNDDKSSHKAVRGDLATILGIATPPPIIKKKPAVVYGDQGNRKLPSLAINKEKVEQKANQERGMIDIPGQENIVSAWINSLPTPSAEQMKAFE
ncbi:Flp pilus assembly protein CpaB [Pelistega sp. NLN82]|uniref:Flp pilus assembly protein CpaB n=1 Tax=Pelistega ratti TaxID=2652177 RepID=A0A6L9Y5W5_9BURK|nr:Flp pilus assembly protein CpaB [Pelistega ratti]NEN75204.1 Flp pilus assembly protein CpaB [Pelistega ratti]